MKKLHLLGAVCAFIICLLPTIANAAILERDWKTSGDALITYDSATNLEWLELTSSLDVSYNQMLLEFGAGGLFEGFRYAILSDISTLWSNAGVPASTNQVFGDPAGIAATHDLLTKLGIDRISIGPNSTEYLTLAMYQGSDPTTLDTPVAYLSWADAFNPYYDNRLWAGTWSKPGPSVDVGSWLIRDAAVVPIPSALWLFGSGLMGLIGVARKKAA